MWIDGSSFGNPGKVGFWWLDDQGHRWLLVMPRNQESNHLGGGPEVRAWDQEVCSLCGLRFEPCGCSYDGHWRLTWSLTSGLVGLVEVRASWPGHPR